MVLEKTLESPWDRKGIKPINPKENGRTDGITDSVTKNQKDSWLAGKDRGQEEKGTTEDEMAGWHHRLRGHEFEQRWEIVKDREASRAAVHGVAKSWAQLGD